MSDPQSDINKALDERIVNIVAFSTATSEQLGAALDMIVANADTLKKHNEVLDNLSKTLTDVDDRVSNAFRGIKQQVADVTEKATDTESQVATLHRTVNDYREQRIRERVCHLERTASDYGDRIDTLEGRIDALATELGILSNARIFHLEQTKDDHESRIDDLER